MPTPTPEELRRMIDEALDEIEKTEANVIALFEDLGGPELATRLLSYYEQSATSPRLTPLRPPEASSGPSSTPPATR